MQKNDETTKTAATFLAELGKALIAREGFDTCLAEIVSSHLLTAAPTKDCIEQALTAITALADERVGLAKVRADG